MKDFSSYGYSAINVKKEVATRFRKVSKEISGSHSMALEAMLNFFERNDLSPNDDLGIGNNGTNKRINAVIAILKNIEKHQTLPTKTMMDTLFREMSEMEKEEETFDFGTPIPFGQDEELEFHRKRSEVIREHLTKVQTMVDSLLEKVVHVKGTFGPGHLKLDMDKETFEKLKNELQDVHHHNGPED